MLHATLCRYTPLQDWIQWDSNLSVADYCAKMQGNQWGGGIEMAAVAQLKKIHVLVYEQASRTEQRVTACNSA